MRGNHLVAAIVVATVASGALFLRNRIVNERQAQHQLAALKAQQGREKAENPGKSQDRSDPTAAPKSATATTAVAPDPVKISSRIMLLPRKKPMRWQADLDGDGRDELLIGHQQAAADDWTGGDKGGPRGTVELRNADGKVLHKSSWTGYMHGFWRRAIAVGGGQKIAMYQRSLPDDSEGQHLWLTVRDGEAITGAFKRMPAQVLDIEGDGAEALLMLSHELYQDFFGTGTMDVLRWRDGKWISALSRPVFEACALDPGLGRPLALAAIDRNPPHQLHVLGWNPTPQRYVSRQQIPVEAPDKKSEFHVPQGFALHCAPSALGGTEQHVQYKSRHFAFEDARLRVIQKPWRHPAADGSGSGSGWGLQPR